MSDFVETNYGEGGDTDFMSGSMDTPTTTFQGREIPRKLNNFKSQDFIASRKPSAKPLSENCEF